MASKPVHQYRSSADLQGKAVSKESIAGDMRLEHVTAAILSGALAFSAADTFDAFTQLNELKCQARIEMAKVDFLVVPSAAHHYTVAGRPHSQYCLLCLFCSICNSQDRLRMITVLALHCIGSSTSLQK